VEKEHPVSFACAESEDLLEEKCGPENGTDEEEGDYGTTVPSVPGIHGC
jgi:hypothetical protein